MNLKNIYTFQSIHKNGKNIKFGDTEIEKQKLQQHKKPISIENIDMGQGQGVVIIICWSVN